ncbi:UNVERIFIED_CONTAM: hypothetical protein GTU68_015434, partial [Idotea baltica]|nr:hypothetical protein [Idotea baltica]
MSTKAHWNSLTSLYKDYPSVGLSLDLSRMGLTEETLSEILPRLDAAVSEMQDLEEGGIANVDENRMVGHYWLRKPELAPSKEISSAIESQVSKIRTLAKQITSKKLLSESGTAFTDVLLIGIGGSALGPQFISDALAKTTSTKNLKLHYLDNTDPAGFSEVLSQLKTKLTDTLCLVVSKSGGTVETRNAMLAAKVVFEGEGLDFGKHAIAITTEGSKLDSLAKSDSWIEQVYLWDWVGGRTSVFSAVGLLPAALIGIDIDAFLRGAAEMDSLTRNPNSLENPAVLMAAGWLYGMKDLHKEAMVVLPYRDSLSLFSKYLQQLIMESLGKRLNRAGEEVHEGLAVYGNKGSTDQHAYVQQLRDGSKNFFVSFIQVLNPGTLEPTALQTLEVADSISAEDYIQGFLLGTRNALSESERPSILLSIDTLTAETVAGLIALFERAVGIYASLVNVNAYHQ